MATVIRPGGRASWLPTAEYIVDEKGRKKAVLLKVREYSRLMRRLEELEDALDPDRAVRGARGFRNYGVIRDELRRQGRL